MVPVIISGIFAFLVALFVDGKIINSKHKFKPEISRKIVHVTNYVIVATWPFFTTYKVIIVLELIFLGVTIAARKYHWFDSINNIYRLTWGEQFGAIGVILIALTQPNAWIFATAMLYVGIADAAAALVGKSIGKHTYEYFGHKKSLEGSLAFVLSAMLIMICVVYVLPSGLSPGLPVILLLPIITAGIEGFAPYGLDNLLVPLLVVAVLNRF